MPKTVPNKVKKTCRSFYSGIFGHRGLYIGVFGSFVAPDFAVWHHFGTEFGNEIFFTNQRCLQCHRFRVIINTIFLATSPRSGSKNFSHIGFIPGQSGDIGDIVDSKRFFWCQTRCQAVPNLLRVDSKGFF